MRDVIIQVGVYPCRILLENTRGDREWGMGIGNGEWERWNGMGK